MKEKRMIMMAVVLMAVCLISALCLAGCGSSQQEAPAEPEQAEEQQTEPAQEQEPAQQQEPAEDTAAGDEQKEIGEDKALEIALKDAGVSKNDISYQNVHMDIDDGQTKYEVEFHVGATEYEYDIEAFTGDILEKDVDIDND